MKIEYIYRRKKGTKNNIIFLPKDVPLLEEGFYKITIEKLKLRIGEED